jgi:hypothetical protein
VAALAADEGLPAGDDATPGMDQRARHAKGVHSTWENGRLRMETAERKTRKGNGKRESQSARQMQRGCSGGVLDAGGMVYFGR